MNADTIREYLYRVMIALSVLLNVLLGGYSGQTFSARNWEWKRQGRFNLCWLIDALCEHNHCAQCWAYWRVRKW